MLIESSEHTLVVICESDSFVNRTEYRNLSLSMQEIDEYNKIKLKFQTRGSTIDLSDLDWEVNNLVFPNHPNIGK